MVEPPSLQKYIEVMERLLEIFDELGYRGRSYDAVAACLTHFRAGRVDPAIAAFREFAPPYTSAAQACSDLPLETLSHDQMTRLGMAFMAAASGVMFLAPGD